MKILIDFVNYFIDFLRIVTIIRIMCSCLPDFKYWGEFTAIIYELTEPLVRPIRMGIERTSVNKVNLGIDLSPFVLLIFLSIVKKIVDVILIMIFFVYVYIWRLNENIN